MGPPNASAATVFVAQAVAPVGNYEAGESERFPEESHIEGNVLVPDKSEEALAVLKQLITELTRYGWKPIGPRGDYWFSKRFYLSTRW